MFSKYVRPGANLYLCDNNAVEQLDQILYKFNNPIIISGNKSYQVFLKHYPKFRNLVKYTYNHSASEENMQKLAEQIGSADLIIAIGGGKVMDTSKGVSDILNAKLLTIPTVLGTCASYVPIAAVYNKDHSFK